MKHIFKKIYDILNEEPMYKHNKLKFIPNIVLNSIGYLIYIILLFKLVSLIYTKVV